MFLNQPVVLYRTAEGKAVALEDRCCHRHYPLSRGKVIGESIQCGYHGLRFDGTGTCVEIPGQDMIPRNAKVRSYPIDGEIRLGLDLDGRSGASADLVAHSELVVVRAQGLGVHQA